MGSPRKANGSQPRDPSPLLQAPGPHERFERSTRIAWFDLDKVKACRVAVIGAGALGNEACKNLVLSGFRSFTLADMDRVAFRTSTGAFSSRKRTRAPKR